MGPILQALNGQVPATVPIWLMRQAGRYLPEYRALRDKAGSFLDLCYNADWATEVTLQPIRRFGFDAAIIFSDILVVPHALGQDVSFVEGEGPRLAAITKPEDLRRLAGNIDLSRLQPVFTALKQVRAALPAETALIGFCGAPWTVAGYMIAGRGGDGLETVRSWLYQEPKFIGELIDLLVRSSIDYLEAQFQAGADAVQIFESFAGSLTPDLFEKWSIDPIRRIVKGLRSKRKDARIIVFARGAGTSLAKVRQGTGCDCVGLDWSIDLDFAAKIQREGAVQGNLDPLVLIAGGEAQDQAVARILNALSKGPFIFNLGHGILPQTPIPHVEALVEQVRACKPERG